MREYCPICNELVRVVDHCQHQVDAIRTTLTAIQIQFKVHQQGRSAIRCVGPTKLVEGGRKEGREGGKSP